METRWDREDGQNGTNLNAGENIFNASDTATTSGFSGGSVGHFYVNNNGIEVLSNGHAVHQQDASALSCDMVEPHPLHGRANNLDCAMQEVCTEMGSRYGHSTHFRHLHSWANTKLESMNLPQLSNL